MNKEGALETFKHDTYRKINETRNMNMTVHCVRMDEHKTKEKQQIAAKGNLQRFSRTQKPLTKSATIYFNN